MESQDLKLLSQTLEETTGAAFTQALEAVLADTADEDLDEVLDVAHAALIGPISCRDLDWAVAAGALAGWFARRGAYARSVELLRPAREILTAARVDPSDVVADVIEIWEREEASADEILPRLQELQAHSLRYGMAPELALINAVLTITCGTYGHAEVSELFAARMLYGELSEAAGCRASNTLGQSGRCGTESQAIQYLMLLRDRCCRAPSNPPDFHFLAVVDFRVSSLFLSLRRYQAALEAVRRARANFLAARDHVMLPDCDLLEAKLLANLDRWDESFASLRRVLGTLDTATGSELLYFAYTSACYAHLRKGEYQAAFGYVERASSMIVDVFQDECLRPVHTALLELLRAHALLGLGHRDEYRELVRAIQDTLLDSVASVQRLCLTPREVFLIHNCVLFLVNISLDDETAADKLARVEKAICLLEYPAYRDHHIRGHVLHQLAIARQRVGDLPGAIEAALDSCAEFEAFVATCALSEEDRSGALRQQDPYALAISLMTKSIDYAGPEEHADRIRETFALVERSRSYRIREELASELSRRRPVFAEIDPGDLNRWREQVARLNALDAQATSALQSQRNATEAAAAQDSERQEALRALSLLEDELFGEDQELRSIVTGQMPSLEDTVSALRPHELLVSYYVLSDTILLFWASADGCLRHAVQDIEDPRAYDLQMDRLEELIDIGPINRPAEWTKPLERLGHTLLGPLVESGALVDVSRITVVPADGMHIIPFAALTVPGTDLPLIHDIEVSIVPQAATRFLQMPKQAIGSRRTAIIDPECTLRCAELERDAVAPHFDDIFYRDQGGGLGAARFAEIAQEAAMLHVACHGVFETAEPLMSALKIGPPGAAAERISVRQMYGLAARVDLVVVNACESARVTMLDGGAHIGLIRGLLFFAKHAVGARWVVDDEAAAVFAAEFYSAYALNADPIGAAASAQRAMMVRPALSHPYYWAAYQASG